MTSLESDGTGLVFPGQVILLKNEKGMTPLESGVTGLVFPGLEILPVMKEV